MAISKVNVNISIPSTASSTGSMTMDSEGKHLQSQLTSEKQRLNQLNSDSDMSVEEKEKERRKIQQQIAELNRKLRMERMEQKKEAEKAAKEQEQKEIRREELLEEIAPPVEQKVMDASENSGEEMQDKAVAIEDIQMMLSVGSMLQQERVSESVDRVKEGREGVLEAEIKLDSIYGTDSKAKKEELSSLRREGAFSFDIHEQQTEQKSGDMEAGAKIIVRE